MNVRMLIFFELVILFPLDVFPKMELLGHMVALGFPGSPAGKESAYNARDLGLIPGLGRPPGGRHGNPLQ